MASGAVLQAKEEKKVACNPDSKGTVQIRIASFQPNSISLQRRRVRRKRFDFVLIKNAQKILFSVKRQLNLLRHLQGKGVGERTPGVHNSMDHSRHLFSKEISEYG